ncbi:MAG: OprO/OprP family phosphate-selective porin [Phycisphaerales bacterium]|nr:hypothetical protein [Planctomycetota bacterium]MCH8509622.1 OprO/OprP family phosphate-selective porin [Phycisphaerales bacterium]
MANRTRLVAPLGVLALTPVTLAGDARFEDDAALRSLAQRTAAGPSLSLSGQVQTRYDLNFRDSDSGALDHPDDDVTLGFSLRRTRVTMTGTVTENIRAGLLIDFQRTGSVQVLDAYADWTVSEDLTLRIGQRKLRFFREENVSSRRQLSAERSVVNSVFNQGFSQFVEAGFGGDDWRAWFAVSDGFRSHNTAFDSAREADIGLTARAEMRLGEAGWRAHEQFTSWRGSTPGGLLGASAHWQSSGDTNPSDEDAEFFALTGDFGWVGDGWNAFGAFVWRRTDAPGSDLDDLGFVVQGGVFVADQTEVFARYDRVMPDSDRAPSVGDRVDDFGTLTLGVNHYLVPESHAAKLTVAGMYHFDSVSNTGGVVRPSDGINLLADTERGQIGVTVQFQFLF